MFLGIDVSKNTLDAALIGHNDRQSSKAKHQVFSNDADGHTALLSWLAEQGAKTVHACLEATGTWAVACARVLDDAGHTSVRGCSRLSKVGSSRLRKSLYFPAITALRFNPLIKAFGLRLSVQGKAKMLIIGAAMRKLLHLAYGVLKSGKPFDPAFCSQNT